MSPSKHESLAWAHPIVRDWFKQKFGAPTQPQAEGWPAILKGKSTLISAPTGSGKTFAAFLICLEQLVRQASIGELKNETAVLYVSPLKALGNDIQKNLMQPLSEMEHLAKERGLSLTEIRVAVRSGDTLPRERQAMLKKPPHILVTTPESLYILLTAEKSRAMLATVKTVIVDEIHALANNKRGTHLSLSLERLEALTNHPPIRIGLSATQKPIEKVAHFLVGNRLLPTIINIGHQRDMSLSICTPSEPLGAVASNEMWDEIYDKLAALAKQHRSTLIFVNTRRLSERIAHHLTERLGETQVAAHHGSLSRKIRFAAESQLKNGELKVLVATASVELGIDIGSIDLVCQIGSPRAIAVALQRVGRAGHFYGAISKGAFFATTRDELLECAALVHAIKEGDLDELIIPHEPLDILAQQIVATCATGEWREEDLFKLVKKAFPYTHLSKENFNEILQMLSEGVAGNRGRYGAYLYRDRVHAIVKGRRGSRLSAITSGGAIPENGLFTVIAEPQGVTVGTLDEDFAVESNRGDIILLGTTSWRINRIQSALGRVLVEDAHGAPPSVPFWRGEAPARTNELSLRVANLREKINNLLPETLSTDDIHHATKALTWLKNNCGLDESGATQLINYILQGRALLGTIPTQKTVIAERFFDEAGGMQLIIHAPFGARINKAWGLSLRKRFCRSFNFELQAAATDNGLNISLSDQHSFPLADVFNFLHSNTAKEVLIQAILQSPLFTSRWRFAASRSLALLRFRHGKKVPPNIQRMLSDDLLAAVFPVAAACQDNLAGEEIVLPDHPLVNEAMKDALTEALDVDGFIAILKQIENGEINCIAVDTPSPSVFSHEILNANPYAYLDDAPLEERRARAVEMRRVLPSTVLKEIGKLDQEAINQVQQDAWPDLRNADELHDWLQTIIACPNDFYLDANRKQLLIWQSYIDELLASGRIGIFSVQHKKYIVAVEKLKTFLAIYPDALSSQSLIEIEQSEPSREEAIVTMIRGWMLFVGPITARELAILLELNLPDVIQALHKLESTGLILQGQFSPNNQTETEWCERRLLARIHRQTLNKLRQEIEPVNASQFMRWLLGWQHVAPGTQLRGERGLLQVIKQLQGFEMPANAWEQQVFAKRITDYDSDLLDHLCLSGAIGWGRLSPHPGIIESEDEGIKKRITPSSVAPITFFVREESQWMSAYNRFNDDLSLTGLSHVAKKIYTYLKQKGASFFAEIERGVGSLKSEIEMGLWELVAAGVITADDFDNLRALISHRRRLNKKHRRISLRYARGRWSLLHVDVSENKEAELEATCFMLLARYGVVFRDLISREKIIPRWRDLLSTFRRLEDRGEIRGGRFVEGFTGEQFALPGALLSLRASKKKMVSHNEITISAVDPLNLVGIIVPGERTPAFSGKEVTLQHH